MCCWEKVLSCLSTQLKKNLFGWLEQTNTPKDISLTNVFLCSFQFQHVFRWPFFRLCVAATNTWPVPTCTEQPLGKQAADRNEEIKRCQGSRWMWWVWKLPRRAVRVQSLRLRPVPSAHLSSGLSVGNQVGWAPLKQTNGTVYGRKAQWCQENKTGW